MPVSRLGGGIPLIQDGKIVGGIGVSGGPSREAEEDCAKRAVEAAGFSATPREQ
jgi:uncharacterized protein GlcG (DUF336 family)